MIEKGPGNSPTEKLQTSNFETHQPISVDLFLNVGTLPSEISQHPTFLKESGQRQKLSRSIGNIFKKINDVTGDVDDALDQGWVTFEEVTQLYEDLSDFIQADENNTRLLLYLPFQLLPDFYRESGVEKLTESQDRFRVVYKNAWIRLLYESDPRASFVDGDILEPGMEKPPRIRKIAHLIPDLLEKGILTFDNIKEQLELSGDKELTCSLLEGLIVAKDRRLIFESEWQIIQPFGVDRFLSEEIAPNSQPDEFKDQSLPEVLTKLNTDLAEIEAKYAENSAYIASFSHMRVVWEKSVKIDAAVDQAAHEITRGLIKEDISDVEIEAWCQKDDSLYSKAGIRGITQAAENLSVTNLTKAQQLAKQYQVLLLKLWRTNSLDLKDEIIRTLSHWKHLKLVDEPDLQKFGINLPDLSSPFPVNLEEISNTDLKGVFEALKKIETDPFLSETVYPFMLAFGSRFKGYSTLKADLDLAIFIKPGVQREQPVAQRLHEIPEFAALDKFLEFWVKEQDGKLGFQTVNEESRTLVGAAQIHFLLGGVWIGQMDKFKGLYQDILEKYLDLSRFGEQKDQMRTQLLRQLELDILQYRLMHKGYKRFYPNQKEPGTKHSNLIDWKSDFWDPGYRRVATQLFLSRVFLPDLS